MGHDVSQASTGGFRSFQATGATLPIFTDLPTLRRESGPWPLVTSAMPSAPVRATLLETRGALRAASSSSAAAGVPSGPAPCRRGGGSALQVPDADEPCSVCSLVLCWTRCRGIPGLPVTWTVQHR
ncbi:uncharacterized protein LOC122233484 isoform X2 [Panthera tigris]|nr:uncharacterized protein LOC122233484 isoform X2 [Panthera tigris]